VCLYRLLLPLNAAPAWRGAVREGAVFLLLAGASVCVRRAPYGDPNVVSCRAPIPGDDVDLDAVGPEGFTGRELYLDASRSWTRFRVEWATFPKGAPGGDDFEVTLGEPSWAKVYSWSYAPCWGDRAPLPEFLAVSVPATIRNRAGTLSSNMTLQIRSVPGVTLETRLAGSAAVDARRRYARALSRDTPSSRWRMTLTYRHTTDQEPELTLHNYELVKGRVFRRALYPRAVFTCRADEPCVTPLDPRVP